ncbi:MAG: Flp family type IVb pilin [Rhodospirillales bacterium]|nr:Flp family type IVb pilin [Rhodospirillales bacterium]
MVVAVLGKLLADEGGGPAIEYGLIASLVGVAAFGGLQAYGSSLEALFGSVIVAIDRAVSGVVRVL